MTMPADQAPPGTVPKDGVRSLLAIAFGWTVVTALVVIGIGIVRPPAPPEGWTGWGGLGFGGWEDWEEPRAGIDLEDPAFRIISVNGEPAHLVDAPQYTVSSAMAVLEIEVLKDESVECWGGMNDDYAMVGDHPGTWTVRLALVKGSNYVECWSAGPIAQSDAFEVVYLPDGARATPETTASAAPSASGEPDLFEITSIDGRHPGSAAGGEFTVHQPTVRIDIDQRTPATVNCHNLDAGWVWETEPRRAPQYLEIDLVPGTNAITCTSGKGPVQWERLKVVFVVDPTPSADPDAVIITTVDGRGRHTIPDHGYTTGSRQVMLEGSAPDPSTVVCAAAACTSPTVNATGPNTWAVQVQLLDGTNAVQVHAAGDITNNDTVIIEYVP